MAIFEPVPRYSVTDWFAPFDRPDVQAVSSAVLGAVVGGSIGAGGSTVDATDGTLYRGVDVLYSSMATTPPADKYAMGSDPAMTQGYSSGFMPFLHSSGSWPARFKTAKTLIFLGSNSFSSLVIVGGSFQGLSNTPAGSNLDISSPNIAATYYVGTTLTTYSPVSGGIGSTSAESVNGIIADSANVIYAAGKFSTASGIAASNAAICSQVSVSPTASRSVSHTGSASASASYSSSATPSVSASIASLSGTPSMSCSPSQMPTTTPSSSQTASVSASVAATSSATVSASMTGSVTVSPSATGSTSASPSVSDSASVSPSVFGSTSVSPSVSGSASVSPSVAASVSESASVTGSATASVSVSRSNSQTASATASGTGSATLSSSFTASLSVSHSGTVTPSGSGSVSRSGTSSLSASVSASVSPSASATSSASASASVSTSISATVTASPSATSSTTGSQPATASVSLSPSPSPSVSETVSSSVTPSKSASASSSTSPSVSATVSTSPSVTRSVSPTFVITLPTIDLSMTFVGADGSAMRSGLGVLLRQALVDLSGVQSASVSITQLVTNYTTTTVAELSVLANLTANSTFFNTSNTTAGPTEFVGLNDTALNGPLPNRGSRLLQGSGGSCSPVLLVGSSFTTVTVPTVVVDLDVALPYAFYVDMNATTTPGGLAAAASMVRARIQALLVNGSSTTTSMTSFLAAYSACTGLPPSPGVIVGITQPVLTGIAMPAPSPTADVASGVIIASVFGGIVSAACCCAVCFTVCAACRRRAEGSAYAEAAEAQLKADAAAAAASSGGTQGGTAGLAGLAGVAAFIDVPAAVKCRSACSDAAAGKVTVSAAVFATPGSAASSIRATARCCPHNSIRDVAAALALVHGIPAAELNAATVVCAGRTLTVGIAAEGGVEVKALGGHAGRSLVVEVRFGAAAAVGKAAAAAVAAADVVPKIAVAAADEGEPRLTSYASV